MSHRSEIKVNGTVLSNKDLAAALNTTEYDINRRIKVCKKESRNMAEVSDSSLWGKVKNYTELKAKSRMYSPDSSVIDNYLYGVSK